ncbi:cell division protein [Catellatospora sp. TT07R-123]|uniref:peptidoglycan D,D-transpeptidase FtsI family protein n=1 Tax=Catellatospora sp. TT07R-123 TaxID=2733863 RepID=UPI001B0A7D00|nr:penicillin-binding protein 2 [Catellatospora sp. TT07R-123]GHJ44958.1 cell division protein [Catellatospora sp. TT07R-123]
MARREDEEPPRRDPGRRSGISDARAFTPRGRTVRDGAPRAGQTEDPTADPRVQHVPPTGRARADSAPRSGRVGRPREAAPEPDEDEDELDALAERELRRRRAALRMVRGGRADEPPTRATAGLKRSAGRGEPAGREPRRTPAGTREAARREAAVVPPWQRRGPRRRGGPDRPSAATPTPPRLGSPQRRLRLATVLSLLLFAAIGIRLVQFQLADAPAFAAVGLKERLDEVGLAAPRGAIYDRNGAVLARSVEARFVAVDPELVADPVTTAQRLAPLLGKAPSELEPLLRKGTQEVTGGPVRFRWLIRGLSVDAADMVRAMNLPGIRVERDERRDLPGADLAANLIGFTGTDMTGLAGLEARYDDVLRGHNGELVYEVGNAELRKPIPGGYRHETPAQPGSSLVLTIDRDVQFQAQRILFQNMEKEHATWGAAMVLDVRTGEVIAQASYPTFNAADWGNAKPSELVDAATSIVVDPGSVHKAVTLSAALEEGVVKPDSTIKVGPVIYKGGAAYRDTHPFAEGTRITLPGLMAFSSNVATIKIADKLGPEKLYEYQRAFGLGQPTGIGVPGESSGLVQPPENWSGSSYGSIPIGHGVAVTPLQMAEVYATIANDGVWMQPHLIKQTVDPKGGVTPGPAPQSHRVISPKTAAELRQIMEAVTTVDQATGRSAALPGYRIAGKTGTGSQVVNGKYVKGEVGSFIGMAPAEAPRYVIAVFVKAPGLGAGGKVAGPSFRDLMAFTLRHFKVLPSTQESPTFVTHY